jgi:hypothetical protein
MWACFVSERRRREEEEEKKKGREKMGRGPVRHRAALLG